MGGIGVDVLVDVSVGSGVAVGSALASSSCTRASTVASIFVAVTRSPLQAIRANMTTDRAPIDIVM